MDLKSRVKFLLRQFPFIYPKKVIGSCQVWIDNQHKQKGLYLSQRGPWYKTIFGEEFITNTPPKTLGSPDDKAFYINKAYSTLRANLFYLQNSYILGQKGLILTDDHQVFQEFSHHFGISTLKKFLRQNPFYTFSKEFKKVNGIGAVLISPESHNYYHWLNDVLPRIKLYEQVLTLVDYFCVSANVPAKFLEILPDFGITTDKLLFIEKGQKIHFDHLYAASLPGSEGRAPKWAADFITDKLVQSKKNNIAAKKIYFKRGPGAERKILNEEEIINTLLTKGFEIVELGELTIKEQVYLMQQAKIVVSAHGAALSNLLFANEGTAVVEIFSPDYFRTDCYYTLSSAKKINYWYVIGSKPGQAAWGDIIVDKDLLLKTIDSANE